MFETILNFCLYKYFRTFLRLELFQEVPNLIQRSVSSMGTRWKYPHQVCARASGCCCFAESAPSLVFILRVKVAPKKRFVVGCFGFCRRDKSKEPRPTRSNEPKGKKNHLWQFQQFPIIIKKLKKEYVNLVSCTIGRFGRKI
jgi:hypothetical protein